MPSPATMAAPSVGRSNDTPVAVVPFIRASNQHREPAGIDVTRTLTTSDQDLGVFDIPAYGYLRAISIVVTATGGAGAATGLADAPFTAIKNISFTEPNGATIEQFNSGYDLYLAHKWGGYGGYSDPRGLPSFSNGTSAAGGSFKFHLRIPIELSERDGLGSLPNQNAAATFKLRMSLAKLSEIYSSAPATTVPNVRVEVFIECWDQPESSVGGRTNQIMPPALNTTQFWSSQIFNVNTGNQTVRLTRVGNYVRNLVFVYRNASGARVDDLPALTTLYLDTRPLDIFSKDLIKDQMVERSGRTAAEGVKDGIDTGVYLYDFAHEFDGTLGRENRDLWLPTLGSTRLEIQGQFPTAGTLTVHTNDVAVAGDAFM